MKMYFYLEYFWKIISLVASVNKKKTTTKTLFHYSILLLKFLYNILTQHCKAAPLPFIFLERRGYDTITEKCAPLLPTNVCVFGYAILNCILRAFRCIVIYTEGEIERERKKGRKREARAVYEAERLAYAQQAHDVAHVCATGFRMLLSLFTVFGK